MKRARTLKFKISILYCTLSCTSVVVFYKLVIGGQRKPPMRSYQPETLGMRPIVISAVALRHGRVQLVQMLRDRPAMRQYVQPNDPLWTWCVRQFAGEGVGQTVDWHNEPPLSDEFECDSTPFSRFIRVRSHFPHEPARKHNGEELWAAAVYELCNLQSSKRYNALLELARDRKMNKDEWVKAMCEVEYGTMRNTNCVYNTIWSPLMRERGLPTNSSIYLWGCLVPESFEEWYQQYKRAPNAFISNYEALYQDSSGAPSIK